MNTPSFFDSMTGIFNFMSAPGLPGGVSMGLIIGIISCLIGFVIHFAFAIGVHIDAKHMYQEKKGPFLAGPGIWTLATLVGGIPVVVVYWVIHHSTLRPRPPSDSSPLD